jgi:D-serine deaminase-like pyridoxal phosphate-dependent protein
MRWDGLSTPALTVDADILERNLRRMADYCQSHGLGLRPHTKTHKIPEVARMQVRHGAVGLTVAKVGEAEVMCGAGLDNILVAYPVMGREKLDRLAALALSHSMLVSLDGETVAEALACAAKQQGVTLGVLVEFDAGFGRCGLEPGPACVDLARRIMRLPSLRFQGLMTYPGQIGGNEEARRGEVARVAEKVERVLAAFRKERIPVEIVSAGSTPSAFQSHQIPGLTEIRPGTYVYNDMNTVYQGTCAIEDCAARVVATVVSTAVAGGAIVDAGSKTLSSDQLRFGPASGYGYIVEAPDAPIVKLNEEHGYVDVRRASRPLKVGDVVTIIPNHVCACVNLHDEIFVLRQGMVEGFWRVAARGKIR